jgi:putative membrane protein
MDEYQRESLLFRDFLAVERTRMANERTLMTYVRTSLIIFASGISLIEIYSHITILKYFGILLMPIAFGMIIFALTRFFAMKKKITRKLN